MNKDTKVSKHKPKQLTEDNVNFNLRFNPSKKSDPKYKVAQPISAKLTYYTKKDNKKVRLVYPTLQKIKPSEWNKD